MRSRLAKDAWETADSSPYRWFAELVSDDLEDLREQWCEKNAAAADWLRELRDSVAIAQA